MKTTFILALLSGNALAAQPLLPRVTAKTLTGLQAMDPMVRLAKPAAAEAKAARPDKPSIIKQSTILHDGANWTLVPNGAVAYVPESLKSRVRGGTTGTLLPWLDFLKESRGWLTTCEVTVEQAAGIDPMPADRTAFWAKQDKIVVAVHQGGPITLHRDNPPPNPTSR